MTDRELALLSLCSDGIKVSRIDKYMYFLQKFGLDLSYRYRICASGIKSRTCQKFVDEYLSMGYVVIVEDKLFCTTTGENKFYKICLTYAEAEKLLITKNELNKLSDDDLDMLVVIDMIYNDIKDKKGIQALVNSRDSIEQMVENICRAYTPDKFTEMIGLISNLEHIFK